MDPDIRKQWGKLTDDDVDQVQGDAEVLSGKIQERYGRTLQAYYAEEAGEWLATIEAGRAA